MSHQNHPSKHIQKISPMCFLFFFSLTLFEKRTRREIPKTTKKGVKKLLLFSGRRRRQKTEDSNIIIERKKRSEKNIYLPQDFEPFTRLLKTPRPRAHAMIASASTSSVTKVHQRQRVTNKRSSSVVRSSSVHAKAFSNDDAKMGNKNATSDVNVNRRNALLAMTVAEHVRRQIRASFGFELLRWGSLEGERYIEERRSECD